MVKCIPNVYANTADRKLIEKIEKARVKNENGSYNDWWQCGSCFCTKYDNGYYHIYIPEKSALYGKILRDYRIDRNGQLIDTNKYYSLPTKEKLIEWCAERGMEVDF